MLGFVFGIIILMVVVKAEPIVHGTRVTSVEFPFIVHLKLIITEKDVETPKVLVTNGQCGGSIVTRKTILTAAHCLESLTPPFVEVYAGLLYVKDIQTPGYSNRGEMIDYKIHPDYEDHDIDLALVYLDRELQLLPGKVEIASFGVAKFGYNIEIAGWGFMEKNERSDVQRKATLQVVRQTDCSEKYRYHNNFICIMDPRKKSTFCNGDSGGPVIYKNKVVGVLFASDSEYFKHKDGRKILICSPKYPGVGVNVPRFMGWILKNRQ